MYQPARGFHLCGGCVEHRYAAGGGCGGHGRAGGRLQGAPRGFGAVGDGAAPEPEPGEGPPWDVCVVVRGSACFAGRHADFDQFMGGF